MDDLKAAKRRISAAILDRPGVSGVGLRGECVVVYLESESAEIRDSLRQAADRAATGVPVIFEVAGTFRAQGHRPPQS